MIAYPGRTFVQLYHRMIRGNELATGTVHFEGRDVSFADIDVPVLSFGGASDTIAPVSCVRPIEELAPDVRFEVVPGGHLGMLTGRAARRTTWVILDEFLEQHSTTGEVRAPVLGANRKRRFSSTGSRNLAGTKGRARGAR
jgi:polyhydroxyalkanoate synthase